MLPKQDDFVSEKVPKRLLSLSKKTQIKIVAVRLPGQNMLRVRANRLGKQENIVSRRLRFLITRNLAHFETLESNNNFQSVAIFEFLFAVELSIAFIPTDLRLVCIRIEEAVKAVMQ